jgi:elongation factor G
MMVEITVPDEFLSAIINDLNGRRAEVIEIGRRGDLRLARVSAPLSMMFGYATAARSLSTGRAAYSMEPHKYQAVSSQKAKEILGL